MLFSRRLTPFLAYLRWQSIVLTKGSGSSARLPSLAPDRWAGLVIRIASNPSRLLAVVDLGLLPRYWPSTFGYTTYAGERGASP